MLALSKAEGFIPSDERSRPSTAPSPSPDRSGHFLLLTTSSVNSMSGVYPEPVGALSFSDLSLFPFNFKLSTLNPVAFIDVASSISPLFAALTANTRGGVPPCTQPNHFLFFPHRAHTRHTGSPATPIPSCNCARFPSHTGDWAFRFLSKFSFRVMATRCFTSLSHYLFTSSSLLAWNKCLARASSQVRR